MTLPRRVLVAALVALGASTAPAAQAVNWFTFKTAFIEAAYPADSAFGQIEVEAWAEAQNAHSAKCGGNDGEIHIGASWYHVDAPGVSQALESEEADAQWGTVMEFANVAGTDIVQTLHQGHGEPATVSGWFRVWNEGHYKGHYYPSNPHHVFEVHPVSRFQMTTDDINRPDLSNVIAGFRAYGITPLRRLVKDLEDETWPLAYRQGAYLHVGMAQANNFYQFPARVRTKTTITGGHAWTVDVFNKPTNWTLVWDDLRVITMTGTDIDDALAVSATAVTLQGIFSVNLKRALVGADTGQGNATFVGDAIEFFTYGKTTTSAVARCS